MKNSHNHFKNATRIRSAIVGLILFGQLGCSNDNIGISSFSDDPSITSLNGTWKVFSFEDYAAGEVEHKNEENSRGLDITITYDDTKEPNELSGTNTTNTVLGEFEYAGTRSFRMIKYLTTEIGQPDWADKLTKLS